MTIVLQLTQGQVALISDDAWDRVSQQNWWAVKHHSGKFYAATKINRRVVYLHNFLMQPPTGMQVDHIDRDGGLNCQWDNMRLATSADNPEKA
jgi:hypothetical protein